MTNRDPADLSINPLARRMGFFYPLTNGTGWLVPIEPARAVLGPYGTSVHRYRVAAATSARSSPSYVKVCASKRGVPWASRQLL